MTGQWVHIDSRFFDLGFKSLGRLAFEDINSMAFGRSENPGVPILFGGHNLPTLIEIGLSNLPKS